MADIEKERRLVERDPLEEINRKLYEHTMKLDLHAAEISALKAFTAGLSERVESLLAEVRGAMQRVVDLVDRLEDRIGKHERVDYMLLLLGVVILISLWVK